MSTARTENRRTRFVFAITLGLVITFAGGRSAAADEFIAYRVPAAAGNQAFGGALGMDFDVKRDIVVSRLGVFDDNADGIALSITVRLWDRSTLTEVASIVFTTDDAGDLIDGSRFKTLATPIPLRSGFRGTIAAEGYGAAERLGNSGVAPIDRNTDDGRCAIAFVGGGRYGDPGAFPAGVDAGPANRYAAGTFAYDADPAPASAIAYRVAPATAGNQAFGGALGMDFDVLEQIDITALGVFDDGGDGLALPITAHLYERTSGTAVATLVFTPEDAGDLVEGSRFKDLAEPLTLADGFLGTIVAEGYGEGESLFNPDAAGSPLLGADNGGCLIAFVGTGRFGVTPGEYPATPDAGSVPERYGAGTFRFRPAENPFEAPLPPTDVQATTDDGRVQLGWTAPVTGLTPAGYNVWRSRPGALEKVNPALVTATELVVDGLINGVEHCFIVRSVSTEGLESEDSEEVCARPMTGVVPGALAIAYVVPAGVAGNQAFGGTIGLDFRVESDVALTRLGVFDDGSDGLARPITARLFDATSRAELASIEFTPEDAGDLVGGSRFKPLAAVILLPAGFRGTISAEGYGEDDVATPEDEGTERNGNQNVGPLDLSTNGSGCALAFTGSRFGNAGSYPGSFNAAAFVHAFAAGTFEYSAVGAAVPERPGIAYNVPAGQVGNQAFGGALGMDFNVLQDIRITRLGVFDSGSDGLALPITARLFNRDTQQELAMLVFPPEDAGELIGGSRFKDLPEPLCLPPGFRGVMQTEGYGAGELLGNGGAIPITWSTDDGACLLEFVGSSRFGVTPGVMAPTADGGPVNRYASGTFAFEPSDTRCILPPDPPSGVVAIGGDGEALVRWNAVGGATPAARYKVFRSTAGGAFGEIADVAETEVLDGGLANGVDVCYRVRSVDADGIESEDDSRITCTTPGAAVAGRVVAYEAPAGTIATQPGTGIAYGLDFDTRSRIRIHRLGVFDDGTDGLGRTLAVSIVNRDSGVELARVEFTPESPGVIIGGSRLKALALPVLLPASFHGSVVAEGFDAGDGIHSGGNFPTNPGPCAIAFINSRSGPAGAFPPAPSATTNIHPVAGGTFEFEALDIPTPAAAGGNVAYDVPAGTAGNQAFSGALGMDFDVRQPIVITELGVFDDLSDGLALPIYARLYDRDTLTTLASLDFTPEDPGVLAGGNRFKPLATPLELPAGFRGVIVAGGYGAGERNGNQGAESLGLAIDDGGCLIVPRNGSRYNAAADPVGFPETRDGGPANRYAAGTFVYGPVPAPCPDEGDTHCRGLAVDGPDGGAPGTYTLTATADDDSGDAVRYTFEIAPAGGGDAIVIGPQDANVAAVELAAGTWSARVMVDDDPDCDDLAPDASCAAVEIVVGAPARRVPGDCNQDGVLNISDASCVFGVLFLGNPAEFPCGDGTPADAGNVALLDWQPDGDINIADGVSILNYLFTGGPPHTLAVLGEETTGCVAVPGCSDSPACAQ